jgi:hypothetical protein
MASLSCSKSGPPLRRLATPAGYRLIGRYARKANGDTGAASPELKPSGGTHGKPPGELRQRASAGKQVEKRIDQEYILK